MGSSVVFFGTECDFANTVLEMMIRSGHTIRARVVPGSGNHDCIPTSGLKRRSTERPRWLSMSSQMIAQPSAFGSRTHIPVLEQRAAPTREIARALTELDADFAVVCCYPRRIPQTLVNATRYGGLNVHPSLLPRYRGPDPLFWIYRNGERQTGVTIHHVAKRLDTGDILAQESMSIPIGHPGDVLWRDSAEIGGRLLTDAMESMRRGTATIQPQEEREATYQSWPSQADLVVHPERWEAWRLFHFCRGVLPLGHVPVMIDGSAMRRILGAVAYSRDVRNTQSTGEWIRCSDGWVLLELGRAIF